MIYKRKNYPIIDTNYIINQMKNSLKHFLMFLLNIPYQKRLK